jgi:hypothetical protein
MTVPHLPLTAKGVGNVWGIRDSALGIIRIRISSSTCTCIYDKVYYIFVFISQFFSLNFF